uniref:WGS project CBMI000000000 data, contig CS3069_c002134 n=1 Tax=Fusarium clavum TaxID=2594811 RepID=A0A090N5N1_9HYPO|nr:unnamed protein product [Fusarium clavum]
MKSFGYFIPGRIHQSVKANKVTLDQPSTPEHYIGKKEPRAKDIQRSRASNMRNLGIEPRAPRSYTNGNGEFYH